MDEVLDLFIDLDANDDQLESPTIFASGRDGYATLDPSTKGENMKPLLDMIVEHVPAPEGDVDGAFQFLASNIDYDDYIGRIAVGRIHRGTVNVGQNITICKKDGKTVNVRATKI